MNKYALRAVVLITGLSLALVGTVAATLRAATFGPNVIYNHSAEISYKNAPSQWIKAGSGSNNRKHIWENGDAQDGKRSLRVEISKYTNGDAAWYFNKKSVEGGATYEYRTQYKSNVESRLTAIVTLRNGSIRYENIGTLPPSQDWREAKVQYQMPADITIFSISHGIRSAGYLQNDNHFLGKVLSFDPTPPTVAVTSPAHGSTVSGQVTLAADASDAQAVAGVQFKVNGDSFGAEDTTAPYEIVWDASTLENGSYNITAVARNAAGLTAESQAAVVYVDNYVPVAPAVQLASPADGSELAGIVTIAADAADDLGIAGVQFRLNGENLGVEDTEAPYETVWDTVAVENGSYTLTAVARNESGLTTVSEEVTVQVNNFIPAAPSVWITGPASDEQVAGLVALGASAADAIAIAGVQFYVNGEAVGPEDTTAPYTANWDTAELADGQYQITAVARNVGGDEATSDPVVVTVYNPIAPTVSLIAPAEGSALSGVIQLAAEASGKSGIQSVHFKVDGLTQYIDTEAPYTYDWITTDVENGAHTISATAFNNDDLQASTESVTITVDNQPPEPPTVAITAPQAGSEVSGSVIITAEAADAIAVAGVQFQLNGENLGVEDTEAPYEAAWDTTVLENGPHEITAVARNGAGLTASAVASVSVANPVAPPTPSGWPTAENTGPLVTPTKVYNNEFGSDYGSTSYRITQAGAVLDGYIINRCVYVTVPNVVIRNSIVRCGGGGISAVWYSGTTGGVIEHNELTGTNNNNPSASGATCSNCVIHRNRISNTADGIKTGSNAVVTDNYIGQLAGGTTSSGPTHNDGMQIEGSGINNVLIRGNTIDHNCQAQDGGACNSAIWMQNGVTNITIDNNYFKQWKSWFIVRGNGSSVSDIRVTNNLYQKDSVSGTPIAFTNGASASEVRCNRYSDTSPLTSAGNTMTGCNE